MPQIKVHEKALAHLSRGLYRSPASALRELVSNAWDANAQMIRIDTNYPNFLQLSVQDNGDGFTKSDFESLMDGGIGNSAKRPTHEPLIFNRPIIGRLGIGMLGIAQICGSFTITSKPKKGGDGFRAHIRLYDLLKDKLDRKDKEVYVSDDEDVSPREIDVGEYTFEGFDAEKAKYGTLIISDDIHPTFVRSFRKSLEYETFKQPPLEWTKALRILNNVHSLQELGDYWRLLWELSAACPVPYISDLALPKHLIIEEQERLASYNFKVVVDGIQLYKPVNLRNNPEGYTIKKIEPTTLKIYGKDVSFHGYILVQEGLQIKPDELRGIMIRIKNIGIGYYDYSLLDYRINEGPRSRWVTGEIFVDEGLEDALNIDRDSFNRFHPEFRAIQEHVHQILQKDIFPRVYKQIDVRSKKRAKEKQEKRQEYLKATIAESVKKQVKIKGEGKISKAEQSQQVEVVQKSNVVELHLPNAEDLKTKKSAQQLASAILAIFEIANEGNTNEKRREVFKKLLLDLLTKW
jgi:hypothetical protein